MLAVHDDWKWMVESSVNIAGNEINLRNLSFSVTGSETIFGRDSYLVSLRSNNEEILMWIDKEKRIALKEKSGGYEVRIIEAPFELK